MGRPLVFPVADLPELPRGKGNKIFGLSTKKSLIEEETLLAMLNEGAPVSDEELPVIHAYLSRHFGVD